MTRFCAVLAPDHSDSALVAMGAAPVYHAPPCALGTLPDAQPAQAAGPYTIALPGHGGGRASDRLVAMGQVTLYNRAEVLAELRETPLAPRAPCSDGEVLLRWYAHAGVGGLARVRGMFALAIWDGRTLLLVRDAVGGRKLFYARAGRAWAVSPSLRALRRWPALSVRLNLAAVRSYLTFAYLPGDETLLDDVYELAPGHYLRIEPQGDYATGAFWQVQERLDDPPAAPSTYAAHLRLLLEQVVQSHLPHGQDVAVFLSGGLDSSLVTALAARLHDARVTTYAIHFGTALPNELAYAEWVARHCGTHHRVLHFSGEEVVARLPETIALLDSPVGEPLTTPNMLMARTAAAEGHRVILNGEGGDPCFGGPKNIPMMLFELHRSDPNPAARADAYLRSYRGCYGDLPILLAPDVQAALRDAPHPARFVQPYFETPAIRSYLNRLMLINVRTKGAHHILAKVEALTAAAGLEGRSPLFDRAIVEYAFAIPPQMKLAGTTEKWILKQAVADLLPTMVTYRPKSGMQTPIGYWLRGPWGRTPMARWWPGPLGRLAADVLLGPRGQARGIFRRDTLETWLYHTHTTWPRHANKVWLVLTLELWLQAFLDAG